jgi:hypothetical protein
MKTTGRRHVPLLATLLLAASGAAVGPTAARAQDGAAVEVPLSVRAGRLVVPVRAADGTELSFLVSTGSAVTVLSASGATRAGGGPLTLGGLPVDLEGHQTVDDATLRVDGVVMDGLVSNNTLNDFDVLFDVPGGRLLLKPFGRAVTWPGVTLSEPVRLRVYHGVVLALDVEVQGRTYPAMLDLGAPALLVNQAVLDEAGVTGGTVERFALGATEFRDLPVRVSDHPSIARFSPGGDGFVVVGAPPAMACAIAVSWVHRELRTCVR